jgi:hypothetical protein
MRERERERERERWGGRIYVYICANEFRVEEKERSAHMYIYITVRKWRWWRFLAKEIRMGKEEATSRKIKRRMRSKIKEEGWRREREEGGPKRTAIANCRSGRSNSSTSTSAESSSEHRGQETR